MSELAASRWGLRSVWLTVLLAAALLPAMGQSTALADCTRAFYRGDYALAVQLAETQLRKYPRDAAVRLILARAELAQGKFQQTFEELKTILAFEPRNLDALYYLSVVSREMSEREYQRLFSLAPDSARVHQLLAEAALAAENSSEAEKEFQKALEAGSHSGEVATELAELKRSQSKFDEAIHYYRQAEKSTPLNYDIAYGLGACYTYKQEYAEAIEWLQKAVALAPNSAAGRFALGNALFQNGQVEAAIPELNHALQIEPRMKQAYFLLGRAYSRLGHQEQAEAAIRKLEELNRSEASSQTKDSTGDKARRSDPPN